MIPAVSSNLMHMQKALPDAVATSMARCAEQASSFRPPFLGLLDHLHACEKIAQDRKRAVRLLEMRGMPAIFQDLDFERRAGAILQGLDLPDRPVLIVPSPNRKNRTPNGADEPVDVPGHEARVEPGVAPAPEGVVDVGMVSGQPAAEIAHLVLRPCLRDGRDYFRLREKMRSDQADSANTDVHDASRIDRRDRSAVAVPQQDAALESDRVKH